MKTIFKNPEPPAFLEWKEAKQQEISRKIAAGESGDAIFSILPSSLPNQKTAVPATEPTFIKPDLRHALLEEQGYICCYCCRALENNHRSIIEHFEPKGLQAYRAKVFEYENLLACCDGGERDTNKPRETYCSLSKGNGDPHLPPAIISPMHIGCESHFEFDEQGKIRPANEANSHAVRTIDLLGLNAKSLVLQREKAINTYIFEIWSEEMDSLLEMQQLGQKINGKYQPFCPAIISVLKNYP